MRKALDAGHAAATILPSNVGQNLLASEGLRIAFDGDAVLFSDEAERVYQRDGLDAFTAHETVNALQPLPPGPFKPLLEALHRLQNEKDASVKIRTRGWPDPERSPGTGSSAESKVSEARPSKCQLSVISHQT